MQTIFSLRTVSSNFSSLKKTKAMPFFAHMQHPHGLCRCDGTAPPLCYDLFKLRHLDGLSSGIQKVFPALRAKMLSLQGRSRPYQVVVYNNAAKHFIIDNLDAILTAENMQTEMQGAPWTKDHDDCLIDLYKKSVPVSEIAITLKRSASAVRGRLRKLGFDA